MSNEAKAAKTSKPLPETKPDLKIAALACKLNLFDLEEILEVAIQQIPTIVQAQRISIYLLDKDEQYLIAKRHSFSKMQEQIVEKISVESKESLIPHILSQKKPVLISNVEEYIQKNNLAISLSKRQRYTSGSCMLVPILVHLPNDQEKVLGIMNFAEKLDFTPFTKHDLLASEHCAELLGTAIYNSSVMEKKLGGRHKELLSELSQMKEAFEQKDIKLDEARKKQTQMLPELPTIPGYDIFVQYSPMETIGGDFYDFIPISDNEIGIVVGDVSGHGIEAALVMSMAKQMLKIYSKIHRALIDILSYANEEIFASLKGESFIAVFLGILNTSTHILRYARAGQTYPLIFNPQRQSEPFELRSRGAVVGSVRREAFRSQIEEKSIQLISGDVLLLYTDGAIEAANAKGEEFSLERLTAALKISGINPARDITTYLQQQIRAFSPLPQTDDLTLLCIKTLDIKPVPEAPGQGSKSETVQEAESFIISPDLSYQEELYYQTSALEQKIKELESKLKKTQEEKAKLEEQCEELNASLDMASNDPDSLIKSLRGQLQLALELPRDLIADNERLHQEIDQQKQELRNMELELNHMIEYTKVMESENKKLQSQVGERYNTKRIYTEKLARCGYAIQEELLNGTLCFDKKVADLLKQSQYLHAMEHLENLLNLAFEQMDIAALLTLQKQLFDISRVFLKHFQKLTDPKEAKEQPKTKPADLTQL